MDDLISRQDAVPTIKPEIVTCKECENWDTSWDTNVPGVHYCPMIDGFHDGDFYCWFGERKVRTCF